jgi:hypothetical protein
MKYKNEKELIVDQLEALVCRGLSCNVFPHDAQIEGTQLFTSDMTLLSTDSEITRLFLARKILLSGGDTTAGNTSFGDSESSTATKTLVVKDGIVDEFKKAYDYLCDLRTEKDHGKAIAGLIEVAIFLVHIVTALSANEASRNAKR